jgi:2-isopropylmalate synthase
VAALVGFVKSVIKEIGMTGEVTIDWHGHQDRGLGVINAIAAYEAGADRLHGTG